FGRRGGQSVGKGDEQTLLSLWRALATVQPACPRRRSSTAVENPGLRSAPSPHSPSPLTVPPIPACFSHLSVRVLDLPSVVFPQTPNYCPDPFCLYRGRHFHHIY